MTIAALIARLEEATGPDREIDAAVFAAVGAVNEAHCKNWCGQNGRTDLTREQYLRAWAPEFTASIDAALTLLPEGLSWVVRNPKVASPSAIVFGPGAYQVAGATPAIALCIAILKARAAGGGQ